MGSMSMQAVCLIAIQASGGQEVGSWRCVLTVGSQKNTMTATSSQKGVSEGISGYWEYPCVCSHKDVYTTIE